MYLCSVTFFIFPKPKNILETIRRNRCFLDGIWLSSLDCIMFIWMWAAAPERRTESKQTPCVNLNKVLQEFEEECWQAV